MSIFSGALPRRTIGGTRAQSSYSWAARLTTAMAGTNNDLTFTAKTPGKAGNNIRVRIVVAGASTALSVSVSGNDITINSATSAGSAATSTAAQVIAAVQASSPANALVSVANATGNDGTGVVAAFAFTNLASGADNEWSLAPGGSGWARRRLGGGPFGRGGGFSGI